MIKLIKELDKDSKYSFSKVEMTIIDDLPFEHLLIEIECFIKACGYEFNGHLGIIDE